VCPNTICRAISRRHAAPELRRRPRVRQQPLIRRRDDEGVVSRFPQCATKFALTVALAVDVGRIENIDPEIELVGKRRPVLRRRLRQRPDRYFGPETSRRKRQIAWRYGTFVCSSCRVASYSSSVSLTISVCAPLSAAALTFSWATAERIW
jgi:hypothetical protein